MFAGLSSTENISALYPEDWSRDWLANLKGFLNLLGAIVLKALKRQLAESRRNPEWNMQA